MEETSVFDDYAFVQSSNMNMFVVASSADYKVAIVDMNKSPPEPSYITLKDKEFEGRSRSRQVEWVHGTEFVWVGGRPDEEAYVIDLSSKTLVKTLSNVDARKLLSVSNYNFLGMSQSLNQHWAENGVWDSHGSSSSSTGQQTGSYTGQQTAQATSNNDTPRDNSDTKDTLSVAAIVLSIMALLAVSVNFVANMSKNVDDKKKETAKPVEVVDKELDSVA